MISSVQGRLVIETKILDERVLGWGFPAYGSEGAAGLDLYACIDGPIELWPQADPILIKTGIAVRIADPDWCGLVLPRSGMGHRGLVCGNGTGVIDSDYEGEIFVSAWNRKPHRRDVPHQLQTLTIAPGDRIAQLVLVRTVRPSFAIVTEFGGASARGDGGFGSTGAGRIEERS